MSEFKWNVEYGKPTKFQDDKVVCNFNVVLFMDGTAVGNISGFQVRKSNRDNGHWISPPSTKKRDGKWFDFGGLHQVAKEALITKALHRAEAGELLDRYAHRFNR